MQSIEILKNILNSRLLLLEKSATNEINQLEIIKYKLYDSFNTFTYVKNSYSLLNNDDQESVSDNDNEDDYMRNNKNNKSNTIINKGKIEVSQSPNKSFYQNKLSNEKKMNILFNISSGLSSDNKSKYKLTVNMENSYRNSQDYNSNQNQEIYTEKEDVIENDNDITEKRISNLSNRLSTSYIGQTPTPSLTNTCIDLKQVKSKSPVKKMKEKPIPSSISKIKEKLNNNKDFKNSKTISQKMNKIEIPINQMNNKGKRSFLINNEDNTDKLNLLYMKDKEIEDMKNRIKEEELKRMMIEKEIKEYKELQKKRTFVVGNSSNGINKNDDFENVADGNYFNNERLVSEEKSVVKEKLNEIVKEVNCSIKLNTIYIKIEELLIEIDQLERPYKDILTVSIYHI